MGPAVRELSDRYVDGVAALDPVHATCWGIGGQQETLTDYSPEGVAARADHDRDTLRRLRALPPMTGDADRIAAEVLAERLGVGLESYQAGEWLCELRTMFSPLQAIRACFDSMGAETSEDWEVVAARMAAVPAALAGLRVTLARGMAEGVVAARRQALACAEQAATWGGTRHGVPAFFSTVFAAYQTLSPSDAGLRGRLDRAARAATEAYGEMARFLAEDYAPQAAEDDAVGPERYARAARANCGTDLDLAETYRWGVEEVRHAEAQMKLVAQRIAPGRPLKAVMALLDADPSRSIEGVDAFRAWLQDRMDQTVESLDGRHFDIPAPMRHLEARVAPPGGAAAMYYTPPDEGFTRPGRIWYPVGARTCFPLWGEVAIAYHEGVPGHHLQLAQVRLQHDRLTRFQRTLAFVPAHSEGWALYAERLMGELGYLERPDYELGMLAMSAFRAARVVVDIGLHLRETVPAGQPGAGRRWTPALALAFLARHSHFSPEFLSSEVDRYLGLPGQAISYKVGERAWLAAREDARRRAGSAFDLKSFHARALGLGPMGRAPQAPERGGAPGAPARRGAGFASGRSGSEPDGLAIASF